MDIKKLAEQNMRKYYGSVNQFYVHAQDAEYELKLFMEGYSKCKDDLGSENKKLREALKAMFKLQGKESNEEINKILAKLNDT